MCQLIECMYNLDGYIYQFTSNLGQGIISSAHHGVRPSRASNLSARQFMVDRLNLIIPALQLQTPIVDTLFMRDAAIAGVAVVTIADKGRIGGPERWLHRRLTSMG